MTARRASRHSEPVFRTLSQLSRVSDIFGAEAGGLGHVRSAQELWLDQGDPATRCRGLSVAFGKTWPPQQVSNPYQACGNPLSDSLKAETAPEDDVGVRRACTTT